MGISWRETLLAVVIATTCAVLMAHSTAAIERSYYDLGFMDLGIGARALAMGNACIAIADDGSAGFYNPASLVSLDCLHVGSGYEERFDTFDFWHLTLAARDLGISYQCADYGSIEIVDEYGAVTGIQKYVETALTTSVAVKVFEAPGFGFRSIGLTGKVIRFGSLGSEEGGMDFDVGVLASGAPDKSGTITDLRAGLCADNILGSNIVYLSGHVDTWRPGLRAGIAIEFFHSVLVAVDYDLRHGVAVGAEWHLTDGLAIRAGLPRGSEGTLAWGVGLQTKEFGIDCAYVWHPAIQSEFRVSFNIAFVRN